MVAERPGQGKAARSVVQVAEHAAACTQAQRRTHGGTGHVFVGGREGWACQGRQEPPRRPPSKSRSRRCLMGDTLDAWNLGQPSNCFLHVRPVGRSRQIEGDYQARELIRRERTCLWAFDDQHDLLQRPRLSPLRARARLSTKTRAVLSGFMGALPRPSPWLGGGRKRLPACRAELAATDPQSSSRRSGPGC